MNRQPPKLGTLFGRTDVNSVDGITSQLTKMTNQLSDLADKRLIDADVKRTKAQELLSQAQFDEAEVTRANTVRSKLEELLG